MPELTTPENLGDLLDTTAEQQPNAPAWHFIEGEGVFTYRELRDHVNQAANGFRAIGIGRETHVAIMAANSLAFCASWLALAKLGAVAVAVNTRYTPRELDYALSDSDAEFLIIDVNNLATFDQTQAKQSQRFQSHVITTTPLEGLRDWWSLVRDQPAQFASEVAVKADDLVNIQYTSGTTGFPKGCMLTHRYWMHSTKALVRDIGFPLERVIYNQNFFYMDGPFLASACLHTGACLFIVSRPSANNFSRWVRDFRIQYGFFFEAVYKIAETPVDADNELIVLQTFGFTKANHADLERRFGTRAREAFGMTECGGALSTALYDDSVVGSGSCGVPITDREAAIMNDDGVAVARGEVGELWIRGPGMMLGYYNKPEATAETMVNGWIRTGDLFKQDECGYFYIVGRKKDMVRRNGENIACREVEAVLRELAEVKEVAVVPVPDERVGEEVKAYVQLQSGETPQTLPPTRIIEHCVARLAVFKVPRFIEYRAAFPMTDSARVEKQKVLAESPDLRANSFDRVAGVWR